MKASRIALLGIGGLTLAGSATYLFVYLYRWEWNRALISGILFLAAEVGVVALLVLSRVSEVVHRLDERDRRRAIEDRLRVARREPSRVLDWLKPDPSRTNVFVPILMGAGLILSGLAWLVERIGRATAGRSADQTVAGQLARLGPPPSGFLDDRADPLHVLRAPDGAKR
jgi:hypothetical protein